MTQADSVSSCCKYDRNSLQLKYTSLYSEHFEKSQDTNAEDLSSQFIFASAICKCRLLWNHELGQAVDFPGSSTTERCRHGSDSFDRSEHGEHRVKDVQVPSLPSRTMIDAPTNLTFMDFELFDPTFEQCESFQDVLSITNGSSKVGLDDCKSFDTFDTPRSSEMSLSQGSLCLPPPNSVTSSWSMSNESAVSLPTIYPGDYLEASPSNGLAGVGQWMCETTIELDEIEESQLFRNIGNLEALKSSSAIAKTLDSFESDFYGVG